MRALRFISLLFVLMGSLPLATSAQAAVRRYAIVIGNNASPPEDNTLAPLRFADDDAVRYHQLLAPTSDRAYLLTVADDETQRRYPQIGAVARAPSRAELGRVVAEVKKSMEGDRAAGNDAVLHFVFSGHGSNNKDGEPYLALLEESLTQAGIFTILKELPATRVHLIIDACNAGALVGVRGPFGREVDAASTEVTPAESRAVLERTTLAAFPHVGAIVATSAGKESHEWSRVESGVFSHELISGALGAADINGDRRIEYSELQAFIAAANRAITDPRARPNVRAVPPAVDQRTPLIEWNRPTQSIRFLHGRVGEWGRFHIELANGQRYLDAHLLPGSPFSIALITEERAFLRTHEREALLSASYPRIDASELRFQRLGIASRGTLDESYRRSLFSEPYTPAYYRGFADSQELVPVSFDNSLVVGFDREPGLASTQVLGLSVGGVGLAALVTAGITTVVSLNARSDFNNTNFPAEAARLADKEKTFRLTSIVLGIAGAALTGTGVGLYVFGAPADLQGPDSGSGAGVGISGQF